MKSQRKDLVTRRELIALTGRTAAVLTPLMALAGSAAEDGARDSDNDVLPPGVKAVWSPDQAFSEKTASRARTCINGLWRWQPAVGESEEIPTGGWGYFKAPGSWPGITDYLHKDCQTVFPHPSWRDVRMADITAAWYQREITVPADWANRRVEISAECVNSLAVVFVDGKRAGEIHFPAGTLDLSPVCSPGVTHLLTILVVALPLQAVMLSYTDTTSARRVKGSVERRGLCGDLYLSGLPSGERISDVKVETMVSSGSITLDAELAGLTSASTYRIRARILETGLQVADFVSDTISSSDIKSGRYRFTSKWRPDKLWDIHTPANMLSAELSLMDSGGKILDTASPVRFGFREFAIQGRDFYLNGSRIFLSVVPIDNAQVGAAWATYAAARETMERYKSFGINFVYTHNYGCEPGAHLSFNDILRAADDAGMLIAFSQPHFSHYDWSAPDADNTNGYARHAEFYVRTAQNHPSVVAYAMSHNATGYVEEDNPDLTDGIGEARDSWAQKNMRLAMRAQQIVQRFDSSRVVYHHSSGNLSSMFTVNFYINFTPVQEVSDWFEHWSTKGVKPLFLCEYGVPFSWDWTMYRGWYKGKREWGSAQVPWEFCLAEWDAQFIGAQAYKLGDREKKNIRWEAQQFRSREAWHRWDYPTPVGSAEFPDCNHVMGRYITDNWRSFRTLGVSGISPWEHAMFWTLRPGVDRSRKELPVDWEMLQRPGMSPDYLDDRPQDHTLSFERSDWTPTETGTAVIRNSSPLLFYIGGKPGLVTSKDHIFHPGETIDNQLVVINNSRSAVKGDCTWQLMRAAPTTGRSPAGTGGGVGHASGSVAVSELHHHSLAIETGVIDQIPVKVPLRADLAAGTYVLTAEVAFSTGEVQSDSIIIDVMPPSSISRSNARISLFDPVGQTAHLLDGLGIHYQRITSANSPAGSDLLIIGKNALTVGGDCPSLKGVHGGLRVLVLEQSAHVLEQRLGFRLAEYGLREVFPRVPDHPLLAGISAAHLHDWRGDATLLAPRLKYTVGDRYAPEVKWCGIDETRCWRCGNRGAVASVLIETPACGSFLPVVDGGYSLQYSPLLEYWEGAGVVLFCQMDVTGRTEADPAAARLVHNCLRYLSNWKPSPHRTAHYAGDAVGLQHLEAAGFTLKPFAGMVTPEAGSLVILGAGAATGLTGAVDSFRRWIHSGGHVLGLGLGPEDTEAIIPFPVQFRKAEHIGAYFDAPASGSWLQGISPGEIQNRDPREISLVSQGAAVVGDGVLGHVTGSNVYLSQLVPWEFSAVKPMNQKRTFRRTAVLASRLLANLGVAGSTPLIERFSSPCTNGANDQRWLKGLYLDEPEEWDDPYRFFGW